MLQYNTVLFAWQYYNTLNYSILDLVYLHSVHCSILNTVHYNYNTPDYITVQHSTLGYCTLKTKCSAPNITTLYRTVPF